MPKAYLYVRYSTAEQAQGDSENRQVRLAAAFVQNRPDLALELVTDPIFLDAGVSSFMGDNLTPDKALGKFLKAVDRGEIVAGSALLVESLDRLTRQEILRAQSVFLDILNRNIKIVTTSPAETYVYDSRTGVVDLIVMLTRLERAHAESALKSRRVKDAWKTKRKQAQDKIIITRVCPHWLKVSKDGKKFEIIKAHAKVVQLIFALAETMGYQSIARHLNEKGIKPFSAKSKGWQSSNIVKILLSPAVVGTYQPKSIEHIRTPGGTVRRTNAEGVPIEGYYPAVVSQATFDRIQLRKRARSKNNAGRKGPTVSNLFSHVAACGLCGANMVLVQKGGKQTGTHLVCSIARRGAGCEYRSWSYETLEQSFFDHCQNIDLSDMLPQSSGSGGQLAELQKRELELIGRMDSTQLIVQRLTEDTAKNGGRIPQAIQQHLVKCEDEIEEAAHQLEELRVKIATEESRASEQQVFSKIFAEVRSKLAAAQGADLFELRSALQRAIRHSVLTLKLHHTSEKLSDQLKQVWGAIPKITRHYHIMFRVGVVRALYFHKTVPILLMDNVGAPEGQWNGELLPYQMKLHHSSVMARAKNGKWSSKVP
jgi:DNA invertase Pin-like site-specific DNA recombinase